MIIKKFRIRNYKSIVDSGNCYLEEDLTILAGKNESGKSSLLEALEDFNLINVIKKDVIPIQGKEEEMEISVTFILSVEEINKFFNENSIEKNVNTSYEFEIKKNYYDAYSISNGSDQFLHTRYHEGLAYFEEMKVSIDELYEDLLSSYKKASTINSNIKNFTVDLSDIPGTKSNITTLVKELEANRSSFVANNFDSTAYIEALNLLIEFINVAEKEYGEIKKPWDSLLNMMPNFVLFRSFEDNLPNKIPFKEILSNKFILDLSSVSEFDPKLILSNDTRKIHKHKDSLNINLNQEYSRYWTQDTTQLKIEWDSNDLFFWIEEEDELYMPSQRSKGRQWHISFYLRISARTVEGKVNIILVDEPGLFLHASAQRDIYQRLLNISGNGNIQIIFTTHSPYLLRSDELQRIRLIEKINIESGTKVSNKVHANADKETLTPILTTIGLELNHGIQNINQINNVVVEGPSDIFYMNAFAKIFDENSLNFIFGGGAGNMGNVGTILTGWGCKVLYLFDNDQGKKDGMRNLTKTWFVKKEIIYSITGTQGSIEDLFSKEDFIKYVLTDSSLDIEIDITNSEYLKKHKFDKVLLSRQFLNRVNKDNILLSNDTLNKFKEIFYTLKTCFVKI